MYLQETSVITILLQSHYHSCASNLQDCICRTIRTQPEGNAFHRRNEALADVIIADNPTEAMENAARAGVLDLVTYKQNRIKELKIVKEEFKLIFGESELDKVLLEKNLPNRAAQRFAFS